MAETHRSHWSTLRMAFFGTLIFGALMVIGLAAFPQQSADAAPKDKASSVWCDGSGGDLECEREVKKGDTVTVMVALGKGSYCRYKVTVSRSDTIYIDGLPYGGRVVGKIFDVRGKGAACEELKVVEEGLADFDYTVVPPKKGGGKNK